MKKKIDEYGVLLDSFDLSPFELKSELNIRSNIKTESDELTTEESFLLHEYERGFLRIIS